MIISYWLREEKKPLVSLWELNGSSFEYKIESNSPKDALCQVWLKLAQWFWRRRFLNFANVFSLFYNYLPLEKIRALHLNKLESPLPKDALCQVWMQLAQSFWRRRFLNFFNVFSLFRNYLPLEEGRALHLNKTNPLHPRMLCAKLGWNWLSGSWEDFLITSIYFLYFVIISPLEKAGPFIWTNLNPPHPSMLCVNFGWNWPSFWGKDDF